MRGVMAVSLQSMQHDMKRVDTLAANLANTLTSAYKRELVIERPFVNLIERGTSPSNLPAELAETLRVVADNRVGTLKSTGQSFDLAIGGTGFFQVQTKEGLAYTRQGNFHLDARGRLVAAQGDPVLGKSGEIFLKTSTPSIDELGNIRDPNGNSTQRDQVLAQVKVVEFADSASLEKMGDGLFMANEHATFSDAIAPQLKQAHLENSNVNSMDEMVQLMQTMRHFEAMQKMTQGYDEMLSTAIRKLGDLS